MALNGTINVESVLGSVSAPTLVIETADRARSVVPGLRFADVSRELAEKIPSARLELVAGSFHGTSDLAEADRVIDVIEEFEDVFELTEHTLHPHWILLRLGVERERVVGEGAAARSCALSAPRTALADLHEDAALA